MQKRKYAEFMQTTPISDSTRDYLISWGELEDWEEHLFELMKRDLGENQINEVYAEIKPSIETLKKTIKSAMLDKMEEHLCELKLIAI